jgi:hypothetical protein
MQLDEEPQADQAIVPAATEREPTTSREDVLYPAEQEAPQPDPIPQQDVYDLQMPEGVQLDREMLSSAMPVFQDAGISRDQAQKLVPLVTQVQQRIYAQQNDEFAAVRLEWAKAAKADTEIGGANFKETGRLVGVALKAGGAGDKTHELRELMNESGLGNHPTVLRVFRKLGSRVSGGHVEETSDADNDSNLSSSGNGVPHDLTCRRSDRSARLG